MAKGEVGIQCLDRGRTQDRRPQPRDIERRSGSFNCPAASFKSSMVHAMRADSSRNSAASSRSRTTSFVLIEDHPFGLDPRQDRGP